MKILIFGPPGSGKTTLSLSLAKSLNIPAYHLDKYFFEKNWIERSPELFLADVATILTETCWIIDGNAMRTLETRFAQATIAIYLKKPRLLCLSRIIWRWLSTMHIKKHDGPEGSTNKISWKLLTYLWAYEKRYSKNINDLVKAYHTTLFFTIETEQQLADLCMIIQKATLRT
jgi:adenylate kinase family enzyme